MSHKILATAILLVVAEAGSLAASPRTEAPGASGDERQGAIPPQLVGGWTQAGGPGTSYYDPSTGSHGPANSKQFAYRFHPDGTFEHAALLQSSLYNCTTAFFGYERGSALVEGSDLTLHPQVAVLRSSDTCVAANNYEKPGDTSASEFTWRLEPDPDGGRPLLVLTWPNGFEEVFRSE